MRILVVDDDLSVRRLVSVQLGLAGHEVHIAEDGPAALLAISSIEPDLVVLDVRMPEMNGWQVLKALRAQPAYEQLPVLMLTAAAESSEVELSYALGASAVIGKPYDGDRLAQMVETLILQSHVLN
ncbi:MAG: response regulator [Frankiaceae bacterium]|nr:response regulator [Frankiaceae bacterium]